MKSMQSILELANTTTATAGIASVTPEVWSQEVEQQGENIREARNWVKIKRDLSGRGGDVLHVLKGFRFTTGADVETAPSEAGAKTLYAVDDYDVLDLTPAPYNSGVKIAEDVVEELDIDVIADINEKIAEVLAQYEDEQILSSAVSNAGNAVYGGDATSDGTLNTGDIISTDLFANAITEIEVDRYKPDVCFIHPRHKNVFIKDSQFISAAEYGDQSIVKRGEIGDYLGVRMIVTNNVPSISPQTGTGNAAVMWDSRKALVLALKQDIVIKSDYLVADGAYIIVGRIKFAVGVLFANAICKIAVTNS